ncbi:MAG TPA: NAD-dependent epimerase/dehydratase family protein, partial [Nitrososphaeraceae archaeon]|nr:NAD-dependent epimerase/dehydratase family protein [Nitrososphaeraceae archaeon]
MANYLVTGGLGFVGSHLAEELYNSGHNVTVLDNLSNGHKNNLSHLKDKISFSISNVEHLSSTKFDKRFDGIFHLATAPRSSSLNDPFRDIETNCKGMISVLELAKKDEAKVVFTSNSGIYGSTNNGGGAIDENSINNPTTPYDANKLVSEYYCKIYHNIYNTRGAIVRFATVYGERQRVNESLNWRPLVATFVKNVLRKEMVTVNGDGQQTRDLLYVKDAVQGVIKAMESSSNSAEIFLLSTNTETSVNKVLRVIEDLVRVKANVVHSDFLKG